MQASDVIQTTRLHMDYLKALSVTEEPKSDDWTEDDDEFVETFLKELEAKAAAYKLAESEDDSEASEVEED
jgi:hypothetical protein